LNLHPDHPIHGRRRYEGRIVHKTIDRELAGRLRQLAQSTQATIFMVLLAAFDVLLARYSGVSDVAVGTPTANRTRTETERLIGFLVNTLILRVDVQWDASFRELVRHVRRVTIEAQDHQDIPFERLVEELRPQRTLDRNPLFEVMFAVDNIPMPRFRAPGLQIDVEPVALHVSKFDLNVSVEVKSDDLKIALEYSVDLYEEETAERMLAHWLRLLEAVVQDPDRAVGCLPLLSQSEYDQIVKTWGHSEGDYAPSRCAHELFEQAAQKKPGQVAVECEGKQLSYQELNERANQLAHYLMELGVRPESKVGLLVRRSLDMIVGLLGILKSGAAYMPLDPALPRERL
jgi:non-ribosomal peptide synthetase component F